MINPTKAVHSAVTISKDTTPQKRKSPPKKKEAATAHATTQQPLDLSLQEGRDADVVELNQKPPPAHTSYKNYLKR